MPDPITTSLIIAGAGAGAQKRGERKAKRRERDIITQQNRETEAAEDKLKASRRSERSRAAASTALARRAVASGNRSTIATSGAGLVSPAVTTRKIKLGL